MTPPNARAVAREAGFPARIDTADFTLDGRRLTLTFTSEERLDYRDVLRRIGDRFGARALANGMVTVYRNGSEIGSRSVAGWPYATGGGFIGLWMSGASGAVLDDFGGGGFTLVIGAANPVQTGGPTFIFDPASGLLDFDPDGTAGPETFPAFARLLNVATLSVDDFVVV